MIAILRFADRTFMVVLSAVSSALLALAACLGLLQVSSRFFFKFPFEWTEVLVRISLNWMVFLGMAVLFRTGSMITMDLMRRKLPARWRKTHEMVLLMLTLVFLTMLGWCGLDYTLRSTRQAIIGLEFMTVFWAYLAIPVGCLFAAFATIAHYFDPPQDSADAELEHTI